MTNWEMYKDSILKITSAGYGLAMVEGEPKTCSSTNCDTCIFGNRPANTSCHAARLEWLNGEYKERKEGMSCGNCKYFCLAKGLESTGVCSISLNTIRTDDICAWYEKEELK